jgi:hypothetical protein
MQATCSSATSVDFPRSTRRYIPEDRTLHNQRYEDLKCYKGFSILIRSGTVFSRNVTKQLLYFLGVCHKDGSKPNLI